MLLDCSWMGLAVAASISTEWSAGILDEEAWARDLSTLLNMLILFLARQPCGRVERLLPIWGMEQLS